MPYYSHLFHSDPSYKATLKGDIFQLKILMFCALRACYAKDGNAQHFILNTEVSEAEKFDDLVIEYPTHATVLQAKHTTTTDDYGVIHFRQGYKGEASLAKYFDSFVRIHKKQIFGQKSVNFIFFTNRHLSTRDGLQNCFVTTQEPEKALVFEEYNGQCYKFHSDFINNNGLMPEIYISFITSIKEHSREYYSMLSRQLIIHAAPHGPVIERAALNLISSITTDLVSELPNYQTTGRLHIKSLIGKFAKERNLLIGVFQKVDDQPESNLFKFSDNFINNSKLSSFSLWLRSRILSVLDERLKLQYPSYSSNENYCISLLKMCYFYLPNKSFDQVWQHADGLNHVQPNYAISNNILRWNVTLEDAYSIIGMFGNFSFNYNPQEDNGPLSELPIYTKLHTAIIAAIKQSGQVDVVKIEQQFMQDVTAFFNAFHVKVAQPNEDELEKIIKKELNTTFCFSGDEYYLKFYHEMFNWMKNLQGRPLTNNDIQIQFQQVGSRIRRLHLNGYSLHLANYYEKLLKISLNSSLQTKIHSFLQSQHTILLLSSQDELGQAIVVNQCVKELITKHIIKEDNWIFIDNQCGMLEEIPSNLLAGQDRCYIILDKAWQIAKNNRTVFSGIISAVITRNHKLILLAPEANKIELATILPTDKMEESFSSLTGDQLAALCASHLDKSIYLAGRYIKIQEILTSKKGGIYIAMHNISRLLPILQNAQSTVSLVTQETGECYIPQTVKELIAIYELSRVLQQAKMANRILLVCGQNLQDKERVINHLKDYYQIALDKLLHADIDLAKEEAYETIIKNGKADNQSEEDAVNIVIKEKKLIFIRLTEEIIDQKIIDILSLLIKNHSIIIYTQCVQNLAQQFFCAATIVYNNDNLFLTLGLDERKLIGEPDSFKEDENKLSQQYSELSLSTRSEIPSVCITAKAGTGKSTNFMQLFTKWQQNISLDKDYHWLIHINFNDIDETFLRNDLNITLLNYLQQKLGIRLNQVELDLWLFVLQQDLKSGNVKLLLDGWDEVKKFKIELCNRFIRHLPPTVHFDIAMRHEAFETRPCPVYRKIELLTFHEEDLAKYFLARLEYFYQLSFKKNEVTILPSLLVEKLQKFKDKMLKWLKTADKKLFEDIKVPLLAFLLTESIHSYWVNWLNTEEENEQEHIAGPWDQEEQINLVTIYENFILGKAHIFLKKHVRIIQDDILANKELVIQLVSEYINALAEISFVDLFISHLDENFHVADYTHLAERLFELGIINHVTTEIIKNKKRAKFHFIQQTFKEFFAAIYIIKAINRPKTDTVFLQVKNALSTARFEATFKIVFIFIKNILARGANFIQHIHITEECFNILTTPPDCVGIAEINFFYQIGKTIQSISSRELPPIAIMEENTVPCCEGNDSTIVTDQQLNAITNCSTWSSTCDKLEELGSQVPEYLKSKYLDVLADMLNKWSWSYSVKGVIAQKLAASHVAINVQLLSLLISVIKDTRCKSWERRDAVKAMCNTADLNSLINVCREILASFELELFIKNQMLICLEKHIGKCAEFDKALSEILKSWIVRNPNDKQEGDIAELRMRELFLRIKTTRMNWTHSQIPGWIIQIGNNIDFDRLKLLLSIIKEKILSYETIQPEWIISCIEKASKNCIPGLAKLLIDFGRVQNNPIVLKAVDFLDNILINKQACTKNEIQLYMQNVKDEGDRDSRRFWRVDAGIPLAFYLILEHAPKTALAYLIYLLQYRTYEYDVCRIISIHIKSENPHTPKQRGLYLHLVTHYLAIQQKNDEAERVIKLDKYSGLISKLVCLAWQHFSENKYCPLIGIEVIFAIACCYGLPLIQQDNHYNLLFPNASCSPLSSQPLSEFQMKQVKEYIDWLRSKCPDYNLLGLINDFERIALKASHIFTNSIVSHTDNFKRLYEVVSSGKDEQPNKKLRRGNSLSF